MEENIEVKDVQKTEYLDKNGLDMLWAKVKENTHNQVEVERNRAVAKENSIVDSIGEFVSKTTTEPQVINSILGVTGGGIQVFDGADDSNEGAALMPTKLEFGYANNRSAILLRGSEVDGQNGSKITIKTELENPYIKLSDGTDDDHTGGDTLTITNEGISNTDNNADHVYATDGSIADLTQYAKKSEISAGGNVDDVRVNGVSVVENKIANIKPATKENLGVVKVGDGLNVTDGTISVDSTAIGAGNYIPYEDFTDGQGYWFPYKQSLFINKEKYGNTGTGINPGKIIVGDTGGVVYVGQNTTGFGVSVDYNYKIRSILTIDNLEIYHYIDNERYIGVRLNKEGISLLNGDNNHVLTSHGSTIDITQYAKKTDLPSVPTKVSQLQNDSEFIAKSVYDEKIATLEARIAALEAKHAEAA